MQTTSILLRSLCAAAVVAGLFAGVAHAQGTAAMKSQNKAAVQTAVVPVNASNPDHADNEIPCPPFWTVQPNPSMDNSLSYVHDSGDIAVSVTYIADKSGTQVGPETFSRVAAEQMNCTLPVKSNILNKAWAFNCDDGIEALVYGETGNLVLLSISGRNDETENYFESFITFLSYQSSIR